MTQETTRQELLNALAELGEVFPDWRLGQTLANLAMTAGLVDAAAIWNLEDSEALAAARHLLERNALRRSDVVPDESASEMAHTLPDNATRRASEPPFPYSTSHVP